MVLVFFLIFYTIRVKLTLTRRARNVNAFDRKFSGFNQGNDHRGFVSRVSESREQPYR